MIMVIPLLMNICQTSENLKKGFVVTQTTTSRAAPIKAPALKQTAQSENRLKRFFFDNRIIFLINILDKVNTRKFF